MKIICHADASPSNYFSFGAKAPLVNLYEADLQKLKDEGYTAAFTGLGRLRLILELEKIGMNYFFLDRGYLFGHKKHWIRLSYNSFQMQSIKKVKDWRNGNKLHPAPWRNKANGHILLCPPGKKTGSYYGFSPEEWLEKTLKKISTYTDRRIVIRHKPENKRDRYNGSLSLMSDLEDAYCVVVYNSNAATEAIYSGIPAIVLGDAASKFVSRTEIKDINDLIYSKRTGWLKNIMCNQFTKNEIATGEALDFFLKFYRIKI